MPDTFCSPKRVAEDFDALSSMAATLARSRGRGSEAWYSACTFSISTPRSSVIRKCRGNCATAKPKEQEASEASARRDEGFWVAVLPFKYVGVNADLSALAEGLSEDIVTGLSRFSYLRVIARSSTLRLAKDPSDVRAVGKELGARYVMEGSLRQAGTKLRLAVQVVDATSGAHLWAENYERAFSSEAVFELQDDLVPRIVSTVADMNGVLPRSLSQAVRSRTPEQLTPYEAVLRSFRYLEQVTPGSLAIAREGVELAVEKAPTYADAWAMLAFLCAQEHGQGFNLRADCLTTGLFAARRAVDAAPANHLAHFSLAQALFFQKEFQSFRNAAERTVALNPMDGNSIALLGELLIYAGDWNRGLALVERAKQLNPNHPGWYWYADFYNCYRQRDYRGAIAFLLKADLRGHWGMHAGLAAAHAQLGENDAAGKALQDLLKLRPDFRGWWPAKKRRSGGIPNTLSTSLRDSAKRGWKLPAKASHGLVHPLRQNSPTTNRKRRILGRGFAV